MISLRSQIRAAQIYVRVLECKPTNLSTRKRLVRTLKTLADAGRGWQDFLLHPHYHEAKRRKALPPRILGRLAKLFVQAEQQDFIHDRTDLEQTLNLALECWQELEVTLETVLTTGQNSLVKQGTPRSVPRVQERSNLAERYGSNLEAGNTSSFASI
jgi:hypothetical protein